MSSTGTIKKVAGPLVIASGMRDANMSDVVRVSKQRLIGEIIEMHGDEASIQVYEETSGLRPGETVESTGGAVSVTLAPGILNNIFDGIERPLERIADNGGAFITRGVSVDSLDMEKLWDYVLDGTLSCVGSDHSPAADEEKDNATKDIWHAWGGLNAIQFFLPMMFDMVVNKKGLSRL